MTAKQDFPVVLRGRLRHTTHPDRYQKILETGFILADPPIPDEERWKTDRGPEFFSYVRSLKGVSLFDFARFDPEGYSQEYPLSSWRHFVPCKRDWGASVWIELDRQEIADSFISGEDLVKKWNQEKAHIHTIMPIIEAACLESIPIRAFRRVLLRQADNSEFLETSTR